MDINKAKRIHMIGVGGIGMSALARLFLHEKKEVSGSDREVTPITCGLEALGIVFHDSQVAENITDDIDLVVYTEAIEKDNPEFLEAKKQGIPTMNYFEALGKAMNPYYLIAISGTHGKTTTTAMLTDVLEEASLDPTAIIGSLRSKTGSNFRAGQSKYAVVEACEYRRDFLHLKPDVLVITNIEAEHLDYYKDLADVQDAFRELAFKVPEEGAIIANLSDSKARPCIEGVVAKVIDYSKYVDPLLQLTQPGLHNRMNAAAAKAAAVTLGVEEKVTNEALENFSGTWRRFEYKGELNGAKVYDDYGHHPTEIEATLKGTRELYSDKNIVLVYQPHLASRTERLLDEFVEVLKKADQLILVPTYAARKQDLVGVSSKELAEKIKKGGGNMEYFNDFGEAEKALRGFVTENNVVLVMGAGDVTNLASRLVD